MLNKFDEVEASIDRLIETALNVKAQRDKLVKVLKYVLETREVKHSSHPEGEDELCAKCRADAVIAEVEG